MWITGIIINFIIIGLVFAFSKEYSPSLLVILMLFLTCLVPYSVIIFNIIYFFYLLLFSNDVYDGGDDD